MALKRDIGGVRRVSLYTIGLYLRNMSAFPPTSAEMPCDCLQASTLTLLLRSPEGRTLPGFGRLQPPQHLPVFSEPVWTLLIVITGKFHPTVISGPLYKYSGIS